MTVRVLIPKMPEPEALLPYLRRMHGSRTYVNNGPLVIELEEQIGHAIGIPCRMVSSGTVAIQLALQAMRLPRGSRVLVPAVTFSGTGLAIQNAGHVPVLADVDLNTWQLRPDDVPPDVDAVVPVAAFGMPLDIGPWVAWAEAMNKPVVIDAAGALLDQPTCESRRVAIAYSLHATKFVGAGEGGAVACVSMNVLDRVADLARFSPGGTNAKMSEYHAAVALASLETAEERSVAFLAVRQRYFARLLRKLPALRFQVPPMQIVWRGAPVMMPVLLPENRLAMPTMMALDQRGVECRQWYRPFLSERADMVKHPVLADWLPVTHRLISHMIGLPLHQFMSIDDVDTVCAHLEAVCES